MPYVPNHERIDLGLIGYGSDVPQDVLDEAIARREQRDAPAVTPEEARTISRKRARNAKGQVVADDPTTPDKDEAWQE